MFCVCVLREMSFLFYNNFEFSEFFIFIFGLKGFCSNIFFYRMLNISIVSFYI